MQFKYSAITKESKTEKDVIEAATYHEAIDLLHQRGLIPTELKQSSAIVKFSIVEKLSSVSLQDKILFIKNLGIMLKAGVSLTRALKILSSQAHNPKFRTILTDVSQQIEAGKSFAEALGKYPKIFTNIFISMVRVGEMSGNLDKALEYLTIQLEREHELVSKTKGAMIYPAVIVFAIVLVGVLMSIFVLPSLLGIFKDQGVALPLATRIIIAIVDFMSQKTALALTSMAAIVTVVVSVFKTQAGMRAFDAVLLKTPIFGEISKQINLARFARIMSSMLKSGTPILEGLQVAADSLNNYQYQLAIRASVQDVKVGKTLAASLSQQPKLFSYLITQMIAVGEESGNVDVILQEMAEHYEAEVDDTMRNLSSIIEPVMILVIGAVVGVLALALIGPIYSITQNAGG